MYSLRFQDMRPLVLVVVLLLTPLQTDGAAAEAEKTPSSGRSIWDSDGFFMQKLASFFGGGGDVEKKDEPVRRNERRPPAMPEMIPPQLYYPDRVESPDEGYLAMVGHVRGPPGGGKRGAKKQPPSRGRPGMLQNQRPFLMRGPARKQGEKMSLRRVPVTRPVRQQQQQQQQQQHHQRLDVIYPNNFRIPPPINDPYRENSFNYQNINSILATPPAESPYATRDPTFTDPTFAPQKKIHRTYRPFFPNQNIHPLANEIDSQGIYSSFSPPRQSSFIPRPEKNQPQKNSLLLGSSSEKQITRLKLNRSPADPFFNQISYLEPSKTLRKDFLHPRPAPRPQRVRIATSHPNEGLQYNGSDDFLPSPKEGNMIENAFQPIFRASQSLDVELPASFMKPLHVASGRSLTITTSSTPPPPQIIDFFEKDGVRRPDELANQYEV